MTMGLAQRVAILCAMLAVGVCSMAVGSRSGCPIDQCPASTSHPPRGCALDLFQSSASPEYIVAEQRTASAPRGCATPVSEDVRQPDSREVHGFWLPGVLFNNVSSPGSSGGKNLLLQLRNLTLPLDRPVVIALLSDVREPHNFSVTVQLSLDVTTYGLTVLASKGVYICGMRSVTEKESTEELESAADAFRYLWDMFGVVHTFATKKTDAHHYRDLEHILLLLGRGPIEGATPISSCKQAYNAGFAGNHDNSLDGSLLGIKRIPRFNDLQSPGGVEGYSINHSTAELCKGFRFLKTPNRHLFVIEAKLPGAIGTSEAGAKANLGSVTPLGREVPRTVQVHIYGHPDDIHSRPPKTVHVVLVNRQWERIWWEIETFGLSGESEIVYSLLGPSALKWFGPPPPVYKQFVLTREAWLQGETLHLIDAAQQKFNTTLTASAQTDNAHMIRLHLPSANGTRPDYNVCLPRSSSSCACPALEAAVHVECGWSLLVATVAVPQLRDPDWQNAGMTVQIGDNNDCVLRPIGNDPALLSLTIAGDRCGIPKTRRPAIELLFKNALCPNRDHSSAGSTCLFRQDYRVQTQCSKVTRKGSRPRLMVYRSDRFLTPHTLLSEVQPEESVYVEIDSNQDEDQGGLRYLPVSCEFRTTTGVVVPVIENGCQADTTTVMRSQLLGTFRFKTHIPKRIDDNPVYSLTCQVGQCHGSNTELCKRILSHCAMSVQLSTSSLSASAVALSRHTVAASSGLFHVLQRDGTIPVRPPWSTILPTATEPTGPAPTQFCPTDDSDSSSEEDTELAQSPSDKDSSTSFQLPLVIGMVIGAFFAGVTAPLIVTLLVKRSAERKLEQTRRELSRRRTSSMTSDAAAARKDSRTRSLSLTSTAKLEVPQDTKRKMLYRRDESRSLSIATTATTFPDTPTPSDSGSL